MDCDENTKYLCLALNNVKGIDVISGSVESVPYHWREKKRFGNYSVTFKAESSESLFIPSIAIETVQNSLSGEWSVSTQINYDAQDKMRYVLSSRVGHRFIDHESRKIADTIIDLSNNKHFLKNWQVDNCFKVNQEENEGHVYYISLDRDEDVVLPVRTASGRIRLETRYTNVR